MNGISDELRGALENCLFQMEQVNKMFRDDKGWAEAIQDGVEALKRSKNHKPRVVVHYHNGVCNAVYASDPEAVKVTVIDTDDDDDEDRKERDERKLEVAERLPEYSDYWYKKLKERRAVQ